MHHDVLFESTTAVVDVLVEPVNVMESVEESAVLLGGLHDFDL